MQLSARRVSLEGEHDRPPIAWKRRLRFGLRNPQPITLFLLNPAYALHSENESLVPTVYVLVEALTGPSPGEGFDVVPIVQGRALQCRTVAQHRMHNHSA
jgi:hypothetical protein